MAGIELLFNSADEFVEELKRYKADGWAGRLADHQGHADTKHVVRLTIQKRQAGGGMPLRHVTLVATTLWPIEPAAEYGPEWGLCTLRYYFGEDMHGEADPKCGRAAQQMVDKLGTVLKDMGFDVRSGILLPTDRDKDRM
jgi:hypothetical protein